MVAAQSILNTAPAIFSAMSNWYIDYHHAQLLRLMSMIIVFGVLWPGLCVVFLVCARLVRRFIDSAAHHADVTRGQAI